jgi:hypothetical protein
MKRSALLFLSIFVMLTFMGCEGKKIAPETPNSHPPSIMVDGELFTSTGLLLPIEPDVSAIKTVTSVIKETNLPSKDGEINFQAPDARYAKINDPVEYVVVLMDKEWMKFDKRVDWGVTIKATNIEPTGVTLEFHQSGGNPEGDLQTGSYYWLETEADKNWILVDMLPSVHDVGWTAEAYIIPKNDMTDMKVEWAWLYGELPEGKYRIGKEIMDFKGSGSYDISNHYAYFEIAN